MNKLSTLLAGVVLTLLIAPRSAWSVDIDAEPIKYSKTAPENPITRLQQKLDAGKAKLVRDDRFGYLQSLLRELKVPESSQTLVFSRTSLQRHRIGPKTPRAIYFSDDLYVGYCQDGAVLEISAVDPRLGTVFYTLDQKQADKPRLERGNNCLLCHASSHNQGMPGHLMLSSYFDRTGEAIRATPSYRTNQTSPFDERWGGWYVTGKSGNQAHLGNLIDKRREDKTGRNVTDLSGYFHTAAYPTGHSDIVALMVLAHQAEMHNLIVRTGFETRIALQEEVADSAHKIPPAVTSSRIEKAVEPLVRYLLFAEEARLIDKVEGTSGFAKEFAKMGPRDGKGRSLRDFDLEGRLFKYPCSYLIYSPAIDGLPPRAKDQVWLRLREVLTGKDTSQVFTHLTKADRRAILEILIATKPGLPDSWQK